MKIEAKTLISRVTSKFYRDQMSSVVLSFERFPLSATTYPLLNKDTNLLGSTATVGIKLKTKDRVEIIHIETRVTDAVMEHIIDAEDDDNEDYIYNIKLKDAGIHIGGRYKTDDLLGQVVYVKLNLKQKEEN